MPRISRHQMFMEMAFTASKRSTCSRANNGAILVQDRNVVSIGYNGPPSGEPHCMGPKCVEPGRTGCSRSIHAEANAITRAAATASVRGADLYCTMSPCSNCARLIARYGIGRVFYHYPYRDTAGISELLDSPVKVYRVTPNGDIVDEATGNVIEGELA